jgi:hypothetical protein
MGRRSSFVAPACNSAPCHPPPAARETSPNDAQPIAPNLKGESQARRSRWYRRSIEPRHTRTVHSNSTLNTQRRCLVQQPCTSSADSNMRQVSHAVPRPVCGSRDATRLLQRRQRTSPNAGIAAKSTWSRKPREGFAMSHRSRGGIPRATLALAHDCRCGESHPWG